MIPNTHKIPNTIKNPNASVGAIAKSIKKSNIIIIFTYYHIM